MSSDLLWKMWRLIRKLDSLFQKLGIGLPLALVGVLPRSPKPPTLNDIKILHDSCNFILVDKAPDVLVNSLEPDKKVTVEKQLAHMFPTLVNPKLGFSFHFVHRLDFSTSGILCIAKHRQAAAVASEAFERRTCQKLYLALVRGHLSQNYLEIDEPIGKDSREEFAKIKMASQSMPNCLLETCKQAKTHLLLLETGLYDNYPASKVLLRPTTGRRHQLRVHCHMIGHTIVGDFTYSNRRDVAPPRMFLHAYKLILSNNIEPLDIMTTDPFTKKSAPCWEPRLVVYNLEEGSDKLSKLN